MKEQVPSSRKARLWPALRARPRLVAAMAVGLLAYLGASRLMASGPAAALVAWNAGALTSLVLDVHMMWSTDLGLIQKRAITQDEGRMTILAVVVLAAIAVLFAVGTQLARARDMEGAARAGHVALALLTVVTSWFFTQMVFALHYAHGFYIARARGYADPLEFNGTPDPLYADFLHFSCVIGTSAQTADVSFRGSALRPVGTLHCIVSFFFNASLLALSINVAAGVLV